LRGDEKMSKYDELREKIDNLTAWDKEADDVLGVIQGYLKSHCEFSIALGSVGRISVRVGEVENFAFYTQREKLWAFKAACLWILDQSGLKQKEEKAKKAEWVRGKGGEKMTDMEQIAKVWINNGGTRESFDRSVSDISGIIGEMEERHEFLKKRNKEYGEERSYEGISEDSGGKDGIYLR